MRVPKAVQLPSGNWRAQAVVNGKMASFTASTPEEAVSNALKAKVTAQEEADAKQKKLTLKEAAEQYIASRSNVLSPATIRGYKTIMRNRFQKPASLWKRNIWTINKQVLQEALNTDSTSVNAKTVKNSIAFVQTVLRDYEIDIRRLRLPQLITEESKYLEPEEMLSLVTAVTGTWLELPVLIAMWLGLRRSEIFGLNWSSVDFEWRTIRVEAAVVPDENHKFVEKKETKNRSRRRTTSCPDRILNLLAELEPDEEKRTGRIFRYSPERVRKHLKRTCNAIGISDVGLHNLRHSNATVMLTLGIADKVAMARGGWANEKVMKKIYQHVSDSAQKDADDVINKCFETLIGPETGGAGET